MCDEAMSLAESIFVSKLGGAEPFPFLPVAEVEALNLLDAMTGSRDATYHHSICS
jgi:hypothetical protein